VLATLASVAQSDGFTSPTIDWHALAPDLVILGTLCVVLLADLFLSEDRKGLLPSLAGLGLLGAVIPILTLAIDGSDRTMFGGGYAVDNFALVLKALFIVAGYVVVLLSTNYVAEGDYAEGEYYFLLLSSLLGMVVMASSRDLVSIFVAWYLIVFGTVHIVNALAGPKVPWWWTGLLLGIAELVLGVWAVRSWERSLLTLVTLVGVWAIVYGVNQIFAAFTLREAGKLPEARAVLELVGKVGHDPRAHLRGHQHGFRLRRAGGIEHSAGREDLDLLRGHGALTGEVERAEEQT